jgi:diguanylate cyclase (GGDEF)-like protein
MVLLALAFGWHRAGRPPGAIWAAALGLPLHLVVLSTGGLASPLLPLFILWYLPLIWLWPPRHITALGAMALAWVLLVQVWTGTLEVELAVEAALTFTGGVLPAWVLERARRRDLAPGTELDRILGSTNSGAETEGEAEASHRVAELAATLERVRNSLGSWRAVLWEIDAEADRARPRLVSGGAWPPTVGLTGDPMRLAWDESLTLRLETPPRWAIGSSRACIVPVERPGEYSAILTLEYRDNNLFPTAQALEETAAQLRAYLDMQREAARATAAREQFSTIVALLRRLPQKFEPEEFAAELARATREFTGMSGAAVARWEQDVGHLLALDSDDGGVPLGTAFGSLESEMAIAIRNVTTLIRQRGRGEGNLLPIIAPGERWHAEPRTIAVIPLHGMATGMVGVLALWSAEPMRIDNDQIEILQMVAPYAAMQLHQIQIYRPLREFAERDALTGLYNRRVFDDRMKSEEAHFLRYRRPTALLVLDVDHFKAINDSLGHEAGDAVLRALGSLLRAAVRGADLVARLGGEEFVVLLPETALAGALEIAQRLRRQVETMVVEWQGSTIEVRVSVGVAACPECAPSPQALLTAADAAVYASKNAGRNRVTAAPYGVFHGQNG